MQTFLPYTSFSETAKVLDRQRLGKQRVEAWQIIQTLLNGGHWQNHPAVKMWDGYIGQLALYGRAICREWILRGYKDTMLRRFIEFITDQTNFPEPNWLGSEAFHKAHRLMLLWKNPTHYSQYFSEPVPKEKPEYIWPV